jgi:hypothetical protein
MACYSFYPRTATGTALMFEISELSGDDVARAQALEMLREHGSAMEVQVWREDRLAFIVRPSQSRSWAGQEKARPSPI